MENIMIRYILLASVVAGFLGCDRAEAPGANSTSDKLPPSLLLAAAPADAREVAAVIAGAKDGDTVVVRGIIGGRKEPIASNRAILTLLDRSLKTCDKIPGDSCPTPWDACCETSETIAAASATIQVVGQNGQPLKTTLSGVGGIAPSKDAIVVGKARRSADQKNLVIDATGIHVPR
jgi:hypothetical protein